MSKSAGVTMVELLVSLAVLGLIAGLTLILDPIESPMEAGLLLTQGALREARSAAVVTTSAYRIKPDSTKKLVAETAPSCSSATWTPDPSLDTELPNNVVFTSTSWSVCFTSGGKSTDSLVLGMWHADYGTRHVEVMRGGATKVQS